MKPKSPTPVPSAPRKKRILLVDDHPMLRAGLAALINKQPDLEVCAEAEDAAKALQATLHAVPDLVVTDLTMPGRGGLEFIKDVHAQHSDLPVLVVSMHDETLYAERALRAGARGYLMKEAGGEKLLAAIRHVLSGQVYVSERLSAQLLDSMTSRHPRGSSSPIEKLSDREFQVFQLIGQGRNTREIAQQLHLSPKTVDVHRANIKDKLGLLDATALVRHAVRWVETQDSSGTAR
ncbi:MAG TPA: response regulator transcription factor [Opitutales bacterium]|nr:response regulator transcription factor [Opitutales bacterium]